MPKEKYPLVSIVFPNWNGKDDAINYINSLRNLKYPKDGIEIINIFIPNKSLRKIKTLFK